MKLTLLGATGSIGQQTLSVIQSTFPECEVYALTAHRNLNLLFEQCLLVRPRYVVIGTTAACADFQVRLKQAGLGTIVLAGKNALIEVASATEVDGVIAAIVGGAGLAPTMAATQAGKRILLANKESLVMAGHLLMQTAAKQGATILPLDSEHHALWQCLPTDYLPGQTVSNVKHLTLTASGGPFRTRDLNTFESITPTEACAHPTWVMGQKISIDSATMVNKALEVIEAHYLFHCPYEKIKTLIHPQSVIHGSVTYEDGMTLAQAAPADMRLTIACALAWPKHSQYRVPPLDWLAASPLTFEVIDDVRYPCFNLILQAATCDSARIVANAANEIAVQDFLAGKCAFTDIYKRIAQALETHTATPVDTLDAILALDTDIRREATCF